MEAATVSEVPARIWADWKAGETDVDALAFRFDVSPEFVRRVVAEREPKAPPEAPPERPFQQPKKLSPEVVQYLRDRFRKRKTVDDWMKKYAARLGVGHATIRRAVYGFGPYAR